MTAQTVTTGTPSSPINYDDASISGLVNGDTLTITNGAVNIDADVRWNQQSAVFGNITISSSGGYLSIDGTKVWEIPFSASSGNVPSQSALGSNGVTGGTSGATGELTRVWASGSLTPATSGGAMPTSGFIKLRSKTGIFQSGETITLPGGATITASGAGKRSWIHVVGKGVTTGSGSRLTIPRLGQFIATGDWFDIGTTDGTDNQTFNYPVADQCPAIWIESAAGSGVYEIWLNALDRWTDGAVATGDKRGTYFSCNATTGVITIAARGANNAGLKPPSGCKVRIPNIIISNADGLTPAWDSNILPPSLSSRYGFVTTNAGAIILDKIACNWYTAATSAFMADIKNSCFGTVLFLTSIGTTVSASNCGIGIVDQIAFSPVTINTNFGSGDITDVFASRRLASGNGYVFDISQSADYTFTRCRADAFGASGTNLPTGSGFSAVRAFRMRFVDCISVGSTNGWVGQPCFGFEVINPKFSCRTIGTTQTTDSSYAFVSTVGTTDAILDGYENFNSIENVHPYTSIAIFTNGSARAEIKNIGTSSAQIDMGTVNACGYLLSGGISLNAIIRRCYIKNVRTSAIQSLNTSQGLQVYNLWSDDAKVQSISTLNATIRGARWTHSTTGQSAVYGTHWSDAWVSNTSGRIVIACNEPTNLTTDQCSASLSKSSGSGFDAAGSVTMRSLTDEIIWTMPYFALGVTGFSNSDPTVTGTNAGNHTLDFQYDINSGSGYNGTWLSLTGANLSGITVNPTKGVRLKVRAKCNTVSSSNLLTYISIITLTNATDQKIEYPLPGSIVTISGLISGSRVKITRADTGAILAQDATGSTSLTFDIAYSGSVFIEARNASGSPAYKPWKTQVTISSSSTTTVVALQEID